MDEVEAKDLIDLLETFEDNESYQTRASASRRRQFNMARQPERTKMMPFWADKIDSLRDGGNAVKLAADHRRRTRSRWRR
jgi:hypothetical protein